MRKRYLSQLGAGLLMLGAANFVRATPLDLSGFSVLESESGSVTNNGGLIGFAENATDAALYFFNDAFFVGGQCHGALL